MSDHFKRITAVSIFDEKVYKPWVELVPNNGENWKAILVRSGFFGDDELEWLSDDYDVAVKQLESNNKLLLTMKNYDKINPQTKRRQVENGQHL